MSRKKDKVEGISVLNFSGSSKTSEGMEEFHFDMSETDEDEKKKEEKTDEDLQKDRSQESPPSSPASDIVDSQFQFPIREVEGSQPEQPQTQVLFATPEEEKEEHPAKKPKPASGQQVGKTSGKSQS